MQESPYYSLTVDCYGCCFKVLINDFPVTRKFDGNGMTTTFPINPLIRNGKNSLRIQMFPHPDHPVSLTKLSTAEGILWLAANNDLANRTQIASFKSPVFSDEEGKSVLPPFYEVVGEFQAKVPFADHFHLQSRIIPKQADLLSRLRAEYTNVWKSLQARDTGSFLQKSAIKELELARSLFITKGEREEYVRSAFQNYYSDLELIDLHFQYYQPGFYANGSVVCLEDELGDQPLVFVNRKAGSSTYIQIYFSQNAQGELVIVR